VEVVWSTVHNAGVSPLPAQDHGNGDEHRPWRRVACVCSYTDQWELYLFLNTV